MPVGRDETLIAAIKRGGPRYEEKWRARGTSSLTKKEYEMSRIGKFLIAAIFATGCFASASSVSAEQPPKTSDNWLLDAKDDTERFKLIQKMFGGFSVSMQFVGERYDRTYDAIIDGNYDLATYHWKKIKETIELGYFRRPAREANASAVFLKGPWVSVSEALASKDKVKAKEQFLMARTACIACHVAEKVPFINDQPKFRRTVTFSN
jgi:cytochrome c553